MSMRRFALLGMVTGLNNIKEDVDTMTYDGGIPSQEKIDVYEQASMGIKTAVAKLTEALTMEE
jgi:hypothetical protein